MSQHTIHETGTMNSSVASPSDHKFHPGYAAPSNVVSTIDLSQGPVSNRKDASTAWGNASSGTDDANNTGSEVDAIDLSKGPTSGGKDIFNAQDNAGNGILKQITHKSLQSVFGGNAQVTKSQAANFPGRTTLFKKSKFKAPRSVLQATSANQPTTHSRYMQSKSVTAEAGALQFIGRYL